MACLKSYWLQSAFTVCLWSQSFNLFSCRAKSVVNMKDRPKVTLCSVAWELRQFLCHIFLLRTQWTETAKTQVSSSLSRQVIFGSGWASQEWFLRFWSNGLTIGLLHLPIIYMLLGAYSTDFCYQDVNFFPLQLLVWNMKNTAGISVLWQQAFSSWKFIVGSGLLLRFQYNWIVSYPRPPSNYL